MTGTVVPFPVQHRPLHQDPRFWPMIRETRDWAFALSMRLTALRDVIDLECLHHVEIALDLLEAMLPDDEPEDAPPAAS